MISVVIPFYNHHEAIKIALVPLLEMPSISEVIVIDDHSSIPFESTESKIKVIRNEKNQGPAASRNLGMSLAKEEMVFFIDADVVMTRESLQIAADKLKGNHCDVVIGKVKNIAFSNFFSYYKNYYIHYQLSHFNDRVVDFIYGSFCAVKAPVYWPINMRYAEDNYLGKMIAGEKIILLSEQVEYVHLKNYSFMGLMTYDFKIAFNMAKVALLKRDLSSKFSHTNISQLVSIALLGLLWISTLFFMKWLSLSILLVWLVTNSKFFLAISKNTGLERGRSIIVTFMTQNIQGWGALLGIIYYGFQKE